ncbi:DeoR family fructose operon transcriptional repressor [Pullulanibacillus pueri]|uniref:DeoR family transcriptional regulator n=1 Tax=Pullulanibacillus pueri TaxID=1437324 RepID=A0A8J2ZUI6_9BACL|nr:DeoR/GlpR family DNA-binding transcription regulator [Pullulanibacillus pueri]MBM7681368.1 DeoR family fructose operon transcriptional repressor [Pullulanibacillus pueri]GGH78606.1 DeoR family transcriptional regulator [Pullulanibacillus pueri]
MLTPERHGIILKLLKQQGIVKIHEMMEATKASESTIRRDLIQLEQEHRLRRVHGGASSLQGKRIEPSYASKSDKNFSEKQRIAQYAAECVAPRDSLYLDAGTTTLQMIPYLNQEDLTVVTNGVTLIEPLIEKGITAYLLGGMVKSRTKALIGSAALQSLKGYRFDKCFIGVNGIHPEYGYTTPDPEEARLKETALALSQESFVVADHSKLGEVSFAKITDLAEATLITDSFIDENRAAYEALTELRVVTA